MSWAAYRLVYQAKSPIHIGWHTLGYIKLTHYYITGKSIWGAMTANFTRTFGSPGVVDYKKFGQLFEKDILASYFYPAIDPDIPLLPKYTITGLRYGECSKEDFERLFIKSYGQTAVLPESNTAEDETLHESEYISPCVEIKGSQQQVFFIGYVFIKEGANYKGDAIDIQNIKLAISEIFVGGDRKYGWGRLSLFGEPQECEDIFNYRIKDIKADDLEISLGLKDPIPAHLSISSDVKLKGDIEPLVGREWGEVSGKDRQIRKGFGQKISEAKICWMPGSICLNDEEKALTFRIGAYGILE